MMYGNENQKGDKRTLIAIVLSVIVMGVGYFVQSKQLSKQTAAAPQQVSAPAEQPTSVSQPAPSQAAAPSPVSAVAATGDQTQAEGASAAEAPGSEQTYTISTDLVEAVLSNKGGDIVSLKLKKHRDQDGIVDLIVPGGSLPTQGLSVSFGAPGTQAIGALMNVRKIDDKTIEFYRDFEVPVTGAGQPARFTYRKAFAFRDGEYLFGMAISLENSTNEYLPLNAGGTAYTINFGPQIGPRLDAEAKSGRSDFRKFITLVNGKRRQEKLKMGQSLTLKDQTQWAAISGKYFTFIAIPDFQSFGVSTTMNQDASLIFTNTLSIARPVFSASKHSDSYYFYFGPKTAAQLSRYNYAEDNAFKRAGLRLEEASEGSGMLTWLENILKFLLNLFYKLIPNYGVAIILVTILVKIVFFPLTKKGSIASARMQEFQPKIKEIQDKYKNNPQKMNQEMAELYKKEGFNPMSGCLPLLIQFPIFIAMYNLFNNHFDLRGALFIPGWIPDLSRPEAILTFPPVDFIMMKIDAIRALPIMYLASQLLYGKFTQSASTGQTAGQMKFMMYGMPIMFFFILYNVPSGLLVYWIVQNLLSIVQQLAINDLLKKKKTAPVPASTARPKPPRK